MIGPEIHVMSQGLTEIIQQAIEKGIPEAKAEVTSGSGAGHFNLKVTAAAFAGKPMLQAHRMVYAAIAHLMDGQEAPVHAIDLLQTLAP